MGEKVKTRMRNYKNDIDTNSDIIVAGDTTFKTNQTKEIISKNIKKTIQGGGFSIVNLEAPLQIGSSVPKPGPVISTRDGTAEIISSIGFNGVNLANNHSMDYGYEALQETVSECHSAGLETVGVGDNEEAATTPLVVEIDGKSIALFGGTQRELEVAQPEHPGPAWIQSRRLLARITEAASAHDFVFVIAHGGIEYVPIPPPCWQQRLHSFAEAGADVVVGHHPHVTQGWEQSDGKLIIYSLGNFVFDSSGGPGSECGAIAHFDLCADGTVDWNLTLTRQLDDQVIIDTEEKAEEHTNYLAKSGDLIKHLPQQPGYWQIIADQLYREKYSSSIMDFGTGRICGLIENPVTELDRITRGVVGDRERRVEQERQLAVYMQGEPHKEIIRIGSGLNSGTIPDYRDRVNTTEVEELLAWTGGGDNESRIDRTSRYIRIALNRLL
ncbi:CapA family protein [Natrinema sp. HArc-T2]|uniref:CapA family protein n=1 Tax=Natrinema sp. HArc-T2 TaxID=3242701 RepID=UPI00359E22F0